MGQKVNPNGFRVGVIRDWNTRWYANKKDFANFLVEDKKIRDYLKNKYFEAGIAKIDIARAANKVTVSIHTARPGMLIGKGGVGAFGFVRAHGFFHAAQCRLDFERLVLGYGAKNRAAENQNQIADRRHFIGEGSIGDLRASGTRYDDVAVASHFQNTHGNGDAHVLVSLLKFGKEADVALSRCLFFGGALCFVVAFVQ